jgi:AAA family ATPase
MSHNGVLTSLLNEMDGIEELSGVTVVAATNRPDVLVSLTLCSVPASSLINQDSALMRPGRLDRILFVGAPDLETRKDIFRIRFSTMAVEPGVDVEELAYLVSRLTISAGQRVAPLAPTTPQGRSMTSL